ncbi:hypothetical protein ACOMHN_016293 [Nucella lapillus]
MYARTQSTHWVILTQADFDISTLHRQFSNVAVKESENRKRSGLYQVEENLQALYKDCNNLSSPTKASSFNLPSPTKASSFNLPSPTKASSFNLPSPTKASSFNLPSPTKASSFLGF